MRNLTEIGFFRMNVYITAHEPLVAALVDALVNSKCHLMKFIVSKCHSGMTGCAGKGLQEVF